jgi:hypothetical protein
VFGNDTLRAWRQIRYIIGLPTWLPPTQAAQDAVRDPDSRSHAAKRRAKSRRRKLRGPLRERAYREAVKCIGIMESGANNRGAEVEQLIREGGGVAGQAWCGWFMAAMYRRAGSKAITWQMGAVRLWLGLFGVRKTPAPRRGDAVRFTFDHIGMFVRDLGNDYIETIEGNTGASGTVSDSATGGDGVYRKTRHKSLVNDYLRVYR